MKKTILAIVLMVIGLMSAVAYANPEIGRQAHFVMDANDANAELKVDAGSNCTGGVMPFGDGTAWAEITCSGHYALLPWYKTPNSALRTYTVNSGDTANITCELFDYSNNAGNNQGYNVTQYNSNAWFSDYTATNDQSGGYNVVAHTVCLEGLQQ